MKSVTELIDVMNNVADGDRLRIETEAGEYRGVVSATEYDYPDGDSAGRVRIDVRMDEPGDLPNEVLEVRSSAQTSVEKFTRPILRPPDVAEGESLGPVVDLIRETPLE